MLHWRKQTKYFWNLESRTFYIYKVIKSVDIERQHTVDDQFEILTKSKPFMEICM